MLLAHGVLHSTVTPYCTVASLTGTSVSFPISIHLHPVRSQKKKDDAIPRAYLVDPPACSSHGAPIPFFLAPVITRAPEELLRLC